MNKKGTDFIKCVICILTITLLAGLLLGFVYNITKKPIEEAARKEFDKSCSKIFTDAGCTFEEADMPADIKEEAEALYGESSLDAVYNVCKDGVRCGRIVCSTSHGGYAGDISILVGFDNEGFIKGVSVISINETPGLGMNAQDLLAGQFEGKNESAFILTKNGKSKSNEIDVMSGATVTSNAVTEAVNIAVKYNSVVSGGTE